MKYEGEITELDLLERLNELAADRFTGAIRFENDAIIKIIYFKEGDVLSASTNDRADSIDEILLRSNKVSREHIKQALAKRKETESLGDALLNLGFITRKELTWARRAQVIGIIRSLMGWMAGSFTIVSDYLPKREEGTSFQLPQLIVEIVVTEQDRSKIEAAMEGGEAIFALAPDGAERYRHLGLNEDADSIMQALDGSKSAAELAAGSTMDSFSVYKLVHALKVLGIIVPATEVTRRSPELISPLLESEPEASLEVSFDEPLLPPVELPSWDDAPAMSPGEVAEEQKQFKRGATLSSPTPPITPSSRPISAKPVPKKRRAVPLIALIALVLLGVAGYFGYGYYMKRSKSQVATSAPPAARPRPVPRPATATDAASSTAANTTIVETPPNTTTASAAPVVPIAGTSTSVAPKPAPPVSKPPAVTAQPPATTDSARNQFQQRARDFAAESSSAPYAVQVAFVCETSSLRNAVERGGSEVWYIPASLQGRDCFRVFWGRYADRASALRGASGIPSSLRTGGRPVVVRVSQAVR